MQAKDSATIAYSAEPPVLTVSVLKNGAMDILQKQAVSLDGDSFGNDQKYFEQIPGFFEKLDKASAEPIGSGQIYNEKTFWK